MSSNNARDIVVADTSVLEVIKCLISTKDCDPVLDSIAPQGSTLLIIIVASILVLGICFKVINNLINEHLKHNTLLLVVITLLLCTFLLLPALLPIIASGVPVVAYLVIRSRPNKIIIKRLFNCPLEVAVLLSVFIAYPVFFGFQSFYNSHMEKRLAKENSKIIVAFILPPEDDEIYLIEDDNKKKSAKLSEELFINVYTVMNELFVNIPHIEIVPESFIRNNFGNIRENYNPTEAYRLKQNIFNYRKGEGSPVDILFYHYYSARFGKDSEGSYTVLTYRAEVKKVNQKKSRLEPLDWQVRITKGSGSELRRLSLVKSYDIVQFLIKNKHIKLNDKQEQQVWSSYTSLFKDYYKKKDLHRKNRHIDAEVLAFLTGSENCDDYFCAQQITSAYRPYKQTDSEIKSKQSSTKKEIDTAVSSLTVSRRQLGNNENE